VRGLDVFTKEWVESFKFDFVEESRFTSAERILFNQRDAIAALAGGWPKWVREVLVSTTMRPNEDGRSDAVGLWVLEANRIIIKRDQLTSPKAFAGTLLHEITHARSSKPDVSRGFESALTELIGRLASNAISTSQATRAGAPTARAGLRSTVVPPRSRVAAAAKPKRAKATFR
jgi:hypothetical protein